jgi:ankyrin repeat protein
MGATICYLFLQSEHGTPLQLAASVVDRILGRRSTGNRVAVVSLLLEKGADVNAKSSKVRFQSCCAIAVNDLS